MSDDLRDDLLDIDGVGDATADKILAVFEDHDTDAEPTGYLRRAIDAAESGDDRTARVYLQRYAREDD